MDTQQEIIKLQMQVAELTAVINSLRNGSSIPFDIGAAFDSRLGSGFQLQNLSGGIDSRSVNEAGSATYSVAKIPDGSANAIYEGTIIRIPFYV